MVIMATWLRRWYLRSCFRVKSKSYVWGLLLVAGIVTLFSWLNTSLLIYNVLVLCDELLHDWRGRECAGSVRVTPPPPSFHSFPWKSLILKLTMNQRCKGQIKSELWPWLNRPGELSQAIKPTMYEPIALLDSHGTSTLCPSKGPMRHEWPFWTCCVITWYSRWSFDWMV